MRAAFSYHLSMLIGALEDLIDMIAGADPGLLPGEGAKGMMTFYGMGMGDFDIRQHRFATFQDVYCHIMPE